MPTSPPLSSRSSRATAPSVRARRGRWLRRLGLGLGLIVTSGLAAAPAWAETEVRERLRNRFAGGDDFAIDLDLAGLELRGLSRTIAGGRADVHADRIRIRPGQDALVIEVEGLRAVWRGKTPAPAKVASPSSPSPAPTSTINQPAPAAEARPATDPVSAELARLVDRLHGVPVRVVTRGQVSVTLREGLDLRADDPTLAIADDGSVVAEAAITLGTATRPWIAGELHVAGEAPQPDAPLELELAGPVVLDPKGVARELRLEGLAGAATAAFDLIEPGGGRASVTIRRGQRGAKDSEERLDRLRLDADALPLALLDPLLEFLGHSSSPKRPAVGEARLSGVVEIERSAEHTRARFDRVELRELVLDDPRLAARAVHFGPLTIDGEIAKTGKTRAAQLLLGHQGVQVQLGAQLDSEGLEVDLELPETRCQEVLAALPEGTAPVLAGTELAGSFAARLGLDLDFAALDQAREQYLTDEREHAFDRDYEQGNFARPGTLEFEFPFLEQCEVVRLGPAIDVEGLTGPYHHAFSTGSGRDKRRVLAPGDAGYVELREVPELALAFVILEDWRYWDHDGFDRDQLDKAFWYDLLAGRVARGASTISQQTARSLWLGIDRSIARKLVEALLTVELERRIDKQRILEVYLNVIELGPEIHGVEEAARYHFGKRPEQLDLIEALHLASLAPAPVAYSRRFAHGRVDAQWREHLRLQVRRLRVRGMISEDEAREASRVRLDLVPHPELLEAGR